MAQILYNEGRRTLISNSPTVSRWHTHLWLIFGISGLAFVFVKEVSGGQSNGKNADSLNAR